jgi:peptidoglycan hydrolase-like protein with peptidoglycan-binding domain
VKSSVEQRLPDGNTVRGFARFQMARDSSGKTLSEQPQGCHLDENGQPKLQMFVHVQDPATKTSENWLVSDYILGDPVVNISHPSAVPRAPAVKLTPEELAARRKAQERNQPPKKEYKYEDLGTRTIAGTETHGSRTIRTIPAGEEGNELPLVVVTENWSSKELGMTMMASTDDPRRGKSTWEVEEFSRTEPDAKLFLPPANYKIVDLSPPTETLAKQ